jgi:hypothetical protein
MHSRRLCAKGFPSAFPVLGRAIVAPFALFAGGSRGMLALDGALRGSETAVRELSAGNAHTPPAAACA